MTEQQTLQSQGPSTVAPAVFTWNSKRGGVTIDDKVSRVTLTNVSPNTVRIRLGDTQSILPAKDLLTINIFEERTLRFETEDGQEAEGFLVQHDTETTWQVPAVRAETEIPFDGPIGLTLISAPNSAFVVEWIVDGGVRQRVEPGAAARLSLSKAEAASIILLGMPNTTGQGSASGLFCLLEPPK